MGHFSFLPAGETFVVVEARVFSTTFEHFINIFPDSRTDTGMIPVKLWPVVMKDALELLASDELHTATRQGRYYLICLRECKRETHSGEAFLLAYVAQQTVSAVLPKQKEQ